MAPEANANLLFRNPAGIEVLDDLRDHSWMQVVACRPIAVGEEVLVICRGPDKRGARAPPPYDVAPSFLQTTSGSKPRTIAAPPCD